MLSLQMRVINPVLMNQEIYDRAIKMDMIRAATLLDQSYQYALVNHSNGKYGRHTISSTGEPYVYTGFDVNNYIHSHEDHLGMNLPGQPLCFVFERKIPRADFADYVGLHEYIETIFKDYDEPRNVSCHDKVHEEACRVELEAVFQRDEKFRLCYAQWMLTRADTNSDNSYFERAIPRFGQFVRANLLSPLETLILFRRKLHSRREERRDSLVS